MSGGRPAAKNPASPAVPGGHRGRCRSRRRPEARPQNIPLDVVYEDRDVIVVNKPTGLVVHPAPGHPDGTLVNALLHHCGDSLSGIGGEKRPGIVHRIDRDTSGLIIAAKNDAAHLALAAQLKDHTLARTYECIVVGNLREDSGTVDAPIGRTAAPTGKSMAVVRPPCRHPLGGRRPLPRRHPPALPPGDRPGPAAGAAGCAGGNGRVLCRQLSGHSAAEHQPRPWWSGMKAHYGLEQFPE